MSQFTQTHIEPERVILVSVSDKGYSEIAWESLDELEELAKTAGAVTVDKIIQNREKKHPGTYVGKGKIEEIKDAVFAHKADGIITDDELTPAQLKNLQNELECKVMDRSLLILDIFAKHAHTAEGILQVELAQLNYRSTRLIGLGTSMSRLGGGIGTRGPGEKKLETDRRYIRSRIDQLNSELEVIKGHRTMLRENRKKQSKPMIAIAGYTNSGKSTLLNVLTDASVLEEDKLFATLDPTTRVLTLPEGKEILLTDTVGFIHKLPHHLIKAFQSTLEEVLFADIILQVVDLSNPQYEKHMRVFYETIDSLKGTDIPVLTVFNKIDKLDSIPDTLNDPRAFMCMFTSARTGKGLRELQDVLEAKLQDGQQLIKVKIPYNKAHIVQSIRTYGQLLVEEFEADGIYVEAYLETAFINKFDL
jgi:GTPase